VQSLGNAAFGNGAVLGCDFVGTVEETGEAVGRCSKGATVACLVWGGKLNSYELPRPVLTLMQAKKLE
jgi:NADPH:quinone reductase-like Zn-dependent oxidoreductase